MEHDRRPADQIAHKLQLTVQVREALGGDAGMRPYFLGHLLVELLLDAALIAEAPDRLTDYYPARWINSTRIGSNKRSAASHPTGKLAFFIELFRRERVLWDYLENDRLLVRLNQVLRRVRLNSLGDSFGELLSAARKLVYQRKDSLLEEVPGWASWFSK